MTYKEVLDDLLDIFDRHYMINTWGYGTLTDLVTPFKRESTTGAIEDPNLQYGIDYPYAFLQPTQHQLSRGKSTFQFNLIMMEQCEDTPDAVIKAQSNCYQYIQDVLAEIYYNYDQKYDFTLNSGITPFKEKFNDTVSGMTASISLEIPMVLDDCIAPFRPKPLPANDLYIYVGNEAPQIIGEEPGEDTVIAAFTSYQNPDGQWNVNRLEPNATRTYDIQVTGFVRVVEASTGTAVPDAPVIRTQSGGTQKITESTSTTGWVTETDQTDWRYYESRWLDTTLEVTDLLNFIALIDKPEVTKNVELKDVVIKFYVK